MLLKHLFLCKGYLYVILYSKVFINLTQRSCGKVMFLHLSVILFMGGGSLSVPGVSVQGRVSLSRGVSVQGGLCPGRGSLSGGGLCPGGVCQRGGTHPTGMHSCCFIVYLTWSNFVLSLMSCPEP